MIATAPLDTIGVAPDDASWKGLSREVAESLLRACRLPLADERTYSSVKIVPTPCGQELYVRSSLFG